MADWISSDRKLRLIDWLHPLIYTGSSTAGNLIDGSVKGQYATDEPRSGCLLDLSWDTLRELMVCNRYKSTWELGIGLNIYRLTISHYLKKKKDRKSEQNRCHSSSYTHWKKLRKLHSYSDKSSFEAENLPVFQEYNNMWQNVPVLVKSFTEIANLK